MFKSLRYECYGTLNCQWLRCGRRNFRPCVLAWFLGWAPAKPKGMAVWGPQFDGSLHSSSAACVGCRVAWRGMRHTRSAGVPSKKAPLRYRAPGRLLASSPEPSLTANRPEGASECGQAGSWRRRRRKRKSQFSRSDRKRKLPNWK